MITSNQQLADFLDNLGAAFARGEYPDDATHTGRLKLWEAATALRVAAQRAPVETQLAASKQLTYTEAFDAWWNTHRGDGAIDAFRSGWVAARGAVETPQPAPKQRPFSLWSFLRNVLHQGEAIGLDCRERPYEEYSARMDAAAREREEQLRKSLGLSHETSALLIGKPAIDKLAHWLIHEDECAAVDGAAAAFENPCSCGLDEAIAAVQGSSVEPELSRCSRDTDGDGSCGGAACKVAGRCLSPVSEVCKHE